MCYTRSLLGDVNGLCVTHSRVERRRIVRLWLDLADGLALFIFNLHNMNSLLAYSKQVFEVTVRPFTAVFMAKSHSNNLWSYLKLENTARRVTSWGIKRYNRF